ncbi:hypothetical protein B0H14DRAFT_2606487 [Mycena olivaceomarginata]|nr:hypothetical protein B0H14DRAFT_2606487 [Mycena olivaceomarginata]
MPSTPTESSHDEKRQENTVDIDGLQPVNSAAKRRLCVNADNTKVTGLLCDVHRVPASRLALDPQGAAMMLVRKFGNQLVPVVVIVFGIITIGTGFIHNWSGFYAVKSLLVIAEAFLYYHPGHIFVWEGLITVGIGILLVFLYPSRPETTMILMEEEHKLTSLCITVLHASQFPSWVQIKEVVFNPIVWHRLGFILSASL